MGSKLKNNISHPEESGNGNPTRYTEQVLVVDDDRAICDVIATALEGLGFYIKTVSSADEALAYFQPGQVDLVISDWKMPGMNGIDLLNNLRGKDPYLAAILVTGFGTKETVIEAFTKGKINYYLSKPFKISELQLVVSAAIKERRLNLSERDFRLRLEKEIKNATEELAHKNEQLQQKKEESERLYLELQKRQVEVEGTKNYLENLIESSVDAIISTDRAQNITLFSRAAERMFDQKFRAVTGMPVSQLFSGGKSELTPLLKKLARQKRINHYETKMLNKSGQELVVDVAASLLDSQGDAPGYLFIVKDIAERKRLEEELLGSNKILEKLSITDGLTGLFNHRYFQKTLKEEFQRAKRYKTQMALIMIDLDDFKQVNDHYGHQVGDHTLVQLATLMKESIREVDTPARYGGEEFAVVLPQTKIEEALVVAGRIKESIEKSVRFQEIQPGLTLTASLGVAAYPDSEAKNVVELIRYADNALIRAKQLGKNRIVIGTSTGLMPLGRGERLTQLEKKHVLTRISNMLRVTLKLDVILDFLLGEITRAVTQNGEEVACSIMIANRYRGLEVMAEKNVTGHRRKDFDIVAHLTLEKRRFQVIGEEDEHGPMVSYPITVERPDQGEEVIGIINIGALPTDLDFYQDMANQVALGILNAKLYHEMTLSKSALEVKVNQLMTLSLMGMALQRNAQLYQDYTYENSKLLARCLGQIGFEKVRIYRLDYYNMALHSGVDNAFCSEEAIERISLADLEDDSRLKGAIFHKNGKYAPVDLFGPGTGLSKGEKALFDSLDLSGQPVAVARLVEDEKIKGLVFASKPKISDEDCDSLALFVLHTGLIIENLNLSKLSQEKCRRLAMIHNIGFDLSAATTKTSWNQASVQAVQQLTEILEASEISVYHFTRDHNAIDLLAYASSTAEADNGPAPKIRLKDSEIMSKVIDNQKIFPNSEPMIINNVASLVKPRQHKRYATDSYMGVPLVCGGRLLGIMNVTDKIDRSNFTKDDQELAQTTAGMLASALSRFNLMNAMADKKLQTLITLVRVLDTGLDQPIYDRGRRIADLSLTLANQMGLAEDESEAVQRHAWKTELWHGWQRQKDKLPIELFENLLQPAPEMGSLEDLRAAIGPEANIPNLEPADETTAREIVRTAAMMEDQYFSLKPKKRLPLPEVMLQILAASDTPTSVKVTNALFHGILNEKIKHGARRLKLTKAGCGELMETLEHASQASGKAHIAPETARQLLVSIRESREDAL